MKWKIKCCFSTAAILKYSVYWRQMNDNGCILIWKNKQPTSTGQQRKSKGKIATKTTQYFRKWKIFIARLQIKTWHIRKIYFVPCVHDVMENMVDRSSASAPPSQCQSNTSAQSWILSLCELKCLLFIQVTVMTWDMKAFSLLLCWTSYLRRVFQRSRLPLQNTFLDIESWKRKLSQESVQSCQ